MTSYAIDRLTFRREANGDQVAIVDGVEIVTLTKSWSRVGGSGWSRKGSTGQTHKTLTAAARPHLSAACRDGKIHNLR